ncbi:MAG: phage late control D family protein [Gaiellaceae bacterium]
MPLRSPYYSVKIEGVDVSSWVASVSVTEDDKQADNIQISIPDPRMIYADAIFEGSTAEVDLGYAEANQHALMIRATLTKVELSYPDGGVPTLTLQGEDKSIEMGYQEKKLVRRGKTVGAIVRAVAEPYGFEGGVTIGLNPDPTIGAGLVHQDGKTDLAFLQELAEKYRAKCFVELNEHGNEVLYFIPERRVVKLRRPDDLLLRYRMGPASNLITFSPTFETSYVDRQRQIADLDTNGKKIESGRQPPSEVVVWKLDESRLGLASRPDHDRIHKLYDRGAAKKKQQQAQLERPRPGVGKVAHDQGDVDAQNLGLESRKLGMTASGTVAGTIWLRAKSNVCVSGASSRFNGRWYVTGVSHKIDGSGYKTDFKCVR